MQHILQQILDITHEDGVQEEVHKLQQLKAVLEKWELQYQAQYILYTNFVYWLTMHVYSKALFSRHSV